MFAGSCEGDGSTTFSGTVIASVGPHLPAAAALGDVDPVPALLDRRNDVDACLNGSGVHRIDVLDAELEVDAATTRGRERYIE